MERPYEQIRQMVKLFEYNRLKLRFRNEDERARFIDGWAEHFCETDDAEWNIAVTIMTARRREPNFYNMEKALREAQGIRRERRLDKERRERIPQMHKKEPCKSKAHLIYSQLPKLLTK